MLGDLCGLRVLLLQGPNGPFFRRLAEDLRARGSEVTKVNFSAGDDIFYRGPEVIHFREGLQEWPDFFRALVADRRIEAVLLFGDCRPIHERAVRVAEELGLDVWVLEEGYLRPDYVTIERGGVNGHSRLPKDPDFYRRATFGLPELGKPVPVGNSFWHHTGWAVLHALAATILWFLYPRYRHHRDVNAFRQAFYWVRGALRKGLYALTERGVLERLVSERSGSYFLVPLQVHCDAQVRHSNYARIEEFIEEVVVAFGAHAPVDTLLVVKHHPHDRPYRNYRRLLAELGARHGCADRIAYVHDLHLPTLFKHARGVITMNSTAGISALYHGATVKVLGRAVYDIPGLTYQRPLAEFLVDPGTVDTRLLQCFVRWLREDNQVNGSFYKRVSVLGTTCGLDSSVFGRTEVSVVDGDALDRPPTGQPAA